MNPRPSTHRGSGLRIAAALTGVSLLAACASTPPAPTTSLQAAQQAIASAERDEASRYAPGELSEARTKLASANTEVAGRKMISAERFADESRAEAELASAKSASAKASIVNTEMKRSTGTLIEEMQRNAGDKP